MGCPLLAPMAEEGWTDNKIAELTVKEYLKNIKNVDALILGCTHYPFVRDSIKKVVGHEIAIIDGGEGTVREIKRRLKENLIKIYFKNLFVNLLFYCKILVEGLLKNRKDKVFL